MFEFLSTAIVACALGAICAWLLRGAQARQSLAAVAAQLESLDRQHAERGSEIEALRLRYDAALERLRAESADKAAAQEKAARVPDLESRLGEREALLARHGERLAALETRLAEERKAAEEKMALLQSAEAKLSDAFKALSSDALQRNNQSFIALAQATLEKFQEGAQGDLAARQKAVDELVKPIRESLEKVDGKLGEIEKARVGAYAELSTQVKGLVETQLPMLRNETAQLVKALRQPTVRGRWGEIQLKRVVEMAGMLDHCDFVEQENRTTEDGRLRPDLVVKLPGGKQIVVDAKAAVNAYLDAAEAPDEETQRLRLADHARQVRNHMSALGRKAYWEQFDPTPELVVMFLPGEMFFSAALQQDPSLIEFGVNEKVIPATPTTLIALLRSVAYGWRQEALAQNAQAVADLGRELYSRIAGLAGHWSDVGSRLDKAVEAYNRSVGTLETRVLVSARKLRELKAAPESLEIENVVPVERTTRALQAPALVAVPADANKGI
jgi:DNA recombination protein RmuC